MAKGAGRRDDGTTGRTREKRPAAPPPRRSSLDSDRLVRALQGAYAQGKRGKDLLQLAAVRMRATGSPYTGVYMYMVSGTDLVLDAFDGRPTEHTRIPLGKGLCGRAVAERRDILAADVADEADYLACSIETRSELVVLIRRGDDILGQIDVDSDVVNGFDEAEHAAVKEVADALAALL